MGKTYRKEGDFEKKPSNKKKRNTNSKPKRIKYEDELDDIDFNIKNFKY